ncbi:hypothetical protein [Sulfurospirillum diekertiae]|uniref:Uncharacterized protein n=1 Tax=Sulfurospirillum diekertiae TaxID=1854492 RepID=A0A1Y0HN44_9BACT|nr:hypothetical protein [Sulfurospirillum diekertiae]ARU49521.1 hypothetical protein Sdiek1_2371 [Sulfurospirillum diekertiae]
MTFHFGVLPASQAYNITNLPFVSIFKTLLRLITSEDNTALLGLFIFITITALSIILSYIKMFKNKKYIPIFFYGILIISLGDTVMLYYRDFLKAITIFIALLPILVIGFNKKIIIFVYGILIISVLFSLEEYPFVRGDGFEPLGFTVDIANSYNATALTNFNSKLEILDSSSTRYIKKLLNIDKEILTVKIKNNSNQIWFANANKDGNYATMLTYHFFKVGNLSHPIGGDYRSKLSKNILPNDESIEKMIIYYPKEKGKYILRITLLQHPVAFFYNVGGAFKDIAIEVK